MTPATIPGSVPDRQAACVGERARQAFAESGYVVLAQLRCDVADGELVISGRVPSYNAKQIAQTLIMQSFRSLGVRNLAEVYACD